jgi:hypothetical protein
MVYDDEDEKKKHELWGLMVKEILYNRKMNAEQNGLEIAELAEAVEDLGGSDQSPEAIKKRIAELATSATSDNPKVDVYWRGKECILNTERMAAGEKITMMMPRYDPDSKTWLTGAEADAVTIKADGNGGYEIVDYLSHHLTDKTACPLAGVQVFLDAKAEGKPVLKALADQFREQQNGLVDGDVERDRETVDTLIREHGSALGIEDALDFGEGFQEQSNLRRFLNDAQDALIDTVMLDMDAAERKEYWGAMQELNDTEFYETLLNDYGKAVYNYQKRGREDEVIEAEVMEPAAKRPKAEVVEAAVEVDADELNRQRIADLPTRLKIDTRTMYQTPKKTVVQSKPEDAPATPEVAQEAKAERPVSSASMEEPVSGVGIKRGREDEEPSAKQPRTVHDHASSIMAGLMQQGMTVENVSQAPGAPVTPEIGNLNGEKMSVAATKKKKQEDTIKGRD